MSLSTHQSSHGRLLTTLRRVLLTAVQPVPGVQQEIDSTLHSACAVLYSLLVDHPVDRRGRCRSCRPPSSVLGLRRSHCRVRAKAEVWRHLPAELLRSFLASELGLSPAPPWPIDEQSPRNTAARS